MKAKSKAMVEDVAQDVLNTFATQLECFVRNAMGAHGFMAGKSLEKLHKLPIFQIVRRLMLLSRWVEMW